MNEKLANELSEIIERLKKLRDMIAASPSLESAVRSQLNLFGVSGDLEGINAKECCVRILREQGRPLNALTLAREALRRGYRGGAQGEEDDVLMTTAKSFWARLCRDKRFVEIRPQVFVLSETRR